MRHGIDLERYEGHIAQIKMVTEEGAFVPRQAVAKVSRIVFGRRDLEVIFHAFLLTLFDPSIAPEQSRGLSFVPASLANTARSGIEPMEIELTIHSFTFRKQS